MRIRCYVRGCSRVIRAADVCEAHWDDPRTRAEALARVEVTRAEKKLRRQIALEAATQATTEARLKLRDSLEAEVLAHPAVIRLGELLSLPCYQYDPSGDVQAVVIDCIDSIPIELRRIAFGMSIDRDPLWPVVDSLNHARDRVKIMLDGAGQADRTSRAIPWVYGVSRQRMEEIERRAYRKIQADPGLRKAARELNEPAYRFIRGLSGRGDNT